MTVNAGDIKAFLDADTSGFDSKMKHAGDALDGVSAKTGGLGKALGDMGKIAGGVLAANVIGSGIQAVTGFIGGAVHEATRLGESLNAVNKIFGGSAQTILDWGKQNATSFGLSQQAFNELATPMGAVLKNLGFSEDKVADQTINLTKRAADLASVFNTDVDQALAAINSALRGEANPIERYGVSVNAAAVETRALADTGKKSAAALTDNEKAAARLAIIFDQTASSAGDFADTSNQLANATRIQKARQEELQAQIGGHLVPIMLKWTEAKALLVELIATKVLPALASLAEMVGPTLSAAFGELSSLVSGVSEIFGGGGGFGESIAATSGPLGVFREGIANIAVFIRDNVIPVVKQVGDTVEAFVKQKFAAFKTYFDSDIAPALANIGKAIEAVVQVVVNNWPKIEAIITPIMLQVVNSIETAVNVIGNLFAIIIDLIQGDFSGAWKNLQDLVGVVWDYIVETFRNGLNLIYGLVSLAWSAAKAVGEAIMDGISAGLSAAWGFAGDVASAVLQAIKNVVNTQVIDRINSALDFTFDTGVPGIGSISINPPNIGHLAQGSDFFGGGLAVVGERGRELVSLPRGARVFDNGQSERMMGGGAAVNFNGPVTIVARDREDARRGAGDFAWGLGAAMRERGVA